jgi:hypothetical protein
MSSAKHGTFIVQRRRRFRLHWLSWAVLVFMTAAMVIIIVPGSPGRSIEWERLPIYGLSAWSGSGTPPQWTDYDYIDVDTWSHGWPREYLSRPFEQSDYFLQFDYYPVLWSCREAWSFSEKVYAFSPLMLVTDVVIGLAIIASATVACEIWRRRRRGFRFSLLDASVLIALLCVILGWWQTHSRVHAGEKATDAALRAPNGSIPAPIRAAGATKYRGPDWLQRLVGNSDFLPFCHHFDEMSFNSALLSTDDCVIIPKLSYVETVHCLGRLRSDLIQALAKLPGLKTLDGVVNGVSGPFPFPEEPLVGSVETPMLRRLTHVTTLDLGTSKIFPVDVAHIARMPRLQNLSLNSEDLLIEDLEPLAECPTLRTLSITVAATENERRVFCASHPKLKVEWGTPQHDPALEPRTPMDDVWDVVHVLMHRWQYEDHREEPSGENGGLDFSQIRLNDDRLARLPPEIFPDTSSLVLSNSDATTAMKLINRCRHCRVIDVRNIPLTKSDIETFSFTEDSSELHVYQGRITAQEFCDIARKLEKCSLTIYGSSFSALEVRKIYEATLPRTLTAYKGFRDDESEELKMDAQPALDNPFE